MSDERKRKLLTVLNGGEGGPYIKAPVDQLDRIIELFKQRQIRHWVETHTISVDNKPAVAFINLGRYGDAALAQSILDEIR